MTIKVNAAFKQGMEFPKRVNAFESSCYKNTNAGSVAQAWKETGNFIRKAMNDYGKETRNNKFESCVVY